MINQRLGYFIRQQPAGSYKPQFHRQKLNGRLVIIGNPITAWGLTPSNPMGPFQPHTWALIDPNEAKIVPMQTPVTPEPVQASLQAINSALKSGLISGAPAPSLGYTAQGVAQTGSANSALKNTSLAPPAPAGCTSCGGSTNTQINGVNPSPNPRSGQPVEPWKNYSGGYLKPL